MGVWLVRAGKPIIIEARVVPRVHAESQIVDSLWERWNWLTLKLTLYKKPLTPDSYLVLSRWQNLLHALEANHWCLQKTLQEIHTLERSQTIPFPAASNKSNITDTCVISFTNSPTCLADKNINFTSNELRFTLWRQVADIFRKHQESHTTNITLVVTLLFTSEKQHQQYLIIFPKYFPTWP